MRIVYITKRVLKDKATRLDLDDRCYLASCYQCKKILLDEDAIAKGKGGRVRSKYYCISCAKKLFSKRFLSRLCKEYYESLKRERNKERASSLFSHVYR